MARPLELRFLLAALLPACAVTKPPPGLIATIKLLLVAALGSCTAITYPRHEKINNEDLSIPIPPHPWPSTRIDGPVLQAIRVAADDFLPRAGQGVECRASQLGYGYEAYRVGDVIFVRIDQDTKECGGFTYFDGGATYAIGLDGQILRRKYDVYPDRAGPPAGDDDGGWEVLDGGLVVPGHASLPPDAGEPWIPPWERPDSGHPPDGGS